MSLRRSTALTLASVTMTLGATAPALAVPPRDVGAPTAPAPAPVIVTSTEPSGGVDTPAVILLAAGALLAGAAAGFGGAKVSAGRAPLHPR